MKRSESSVERAWSNWLKRKYPTVMQRKKERYKGWPDREVLPGNGKVFYLEFKREGKLPEPLQLWRHNLLRKRGYKVYVPDTLEQAKNVTLQELSKPKKKTDR